MPKRNKFCKRKSQFLCLTRSVNRFPIQSHHISPLQCLWQYRPLWSGFAFFAQIWPWLDWSPLLLFDYRWIGDGNAPSPPWLYPVHSRVELHWYCYSRLGISLVPSCGSIAEQAMGLYPWNPEARTGYSTQVASRKIGNLVPLNGLWSLATTKGLSTPLVCA